MIKYDTWGTVGQNDPVGSTVVNSGTGINGTLVNGGNTGSVFTTVAGPPLGQAPHTALNYNDGDGGNGNLNGIDTGYTLSAASAADKSFTMSAWVNLADTNGDNMVFGTNGGSPMHLGFRGDQAYMGFWGNDSNSASLGAANIVNKWNFFTWTFNDSTGEQAIYENGINIDDSTGHGAPSQQSEELLVGGNGGNGGDFNGSLADMRVYNFGVNAAGAEAIFLDSFVPEPSTIISLIGLGGIGLIALSRRRRTAK